MLLRPVDLVFTIFGMLLAVLAAPSNATTTLANSAPESDDAVVIVMQTAIGDITLELYPDKAPVTVANFLRYVDARKFDGATFYRTVRLDNQAPSDVPIQVVQGGLYGHAFRRQAGPPPETFNPIPHETTKSTGLSHLDGTISMARTAPGTASSEFFICIGENPALDFGGARQPDGQGFAAFGRVISGMDVVRKIHARASNTPLPEDMHIVKGQVLEERVAIVSVRRLDRTPPR